MSRLALVTGSAGAVLDAVQAELSGGGWTVRHVPVGAGGALRPVEPSGAELVIHLGVRTPRDLDEDARTRVEMAAAAAAGALARASGARRLVHLSTASVYGQPRYLPCREGDIKQPRTVYERVRWKAEQASWAEFRRGAPLIVLRPSILYGPTLRGGPVRALALVALFNQGKRRVPIIRRGPVAHLVHLEDVARAVAHVANHRDDGDLLGRAFNVADDAPLPLAEHFATALTALGFEPGRVLPTAPRLTAALLWLVQHVPDRLLLATINSRLARGWRRLAHRTGMAAGLVPHVDREALHWLAGDHYYDTSRLCSLGWRPRHPVSSASVPETIRALVANQLLPGTGGRALAAW